MGICHRILVYPKNRRQDFLQASFLHLIHSKSHSTDLSSGPLTHDWDAEAAAIAISAVADECTKKSDGGVPPAKVQPVETIDD